MQRLDEARQFLLAALLDHHGPPSTARAGPIGVKGIGEVEPFRRMVEAALGLIAEPKMAASILGTIDEAGLLDPVTLAAVDPFELQDILKQRRLKVAAKSLRPLLGLARWVVDTGFDADRAATASTQGLREAWREIPGIGPATVDAILLIGLGRAAYPIDRSTYRVLVRHGWARFHRRLR